MDDFINLNYAKNIAAIFQYLFTEPTHLTIFIVTAEKAYLCRKVDFEFYADFIFDGLLTEMASRDEDGCLVARTDFDAQYRGFYLRSREKGEEGFLYGPEIYRNQILGRPPG